MGGAAGAIVAGGYLLGPLVGLTAAQGAAIAGGAVLLGGGIQAYNKGGLEGLVDYTAGAIAGAYTYNTVSGYLNSDSTASTSETQQAQAKTTSSLSTDQSGSAGQASSGQNAIGVDQFGNPVDTSMMTAGDNMAPSPQGTPASGTAGTAARVTLVAGGAGVFDLGVEVILAGAATGLGNIVTIPVGLFMMGFGAFSVYLGARPKP